MLDILFRHLAMVRLSIATCAIFALVGCVGVIDSGGDKNLTPEQRIAQQKWLDLALPTIKAATCNGCHAGSQPDIAFLTGASDLAIRDTLVQFNPQVVNLDAPQSSRLLTKGPHNGPALQADQASNILEWINAEKSAAGTGSGSGGNTGIETAKFTPQICTSGAPGTANCPINHVALDGVGLVGAEIQFVAQALGNTDTYVNDLYLKAAADGAYIEHPLFVSWPADTTQKPIPDSIDRFFNVKLDLAKATGTVACPGPSCDSIGGGTAAFVGFPPNNQMTIHFKVVMPFQPASGGGGGGGGGCKRLDSFQTNVLPKLTTAMAKVGGGTIQCDGCHAGANSGATSAMNITGIGGADVMAACNQVRTRLSLQDIPNSGVILAPTGSATHPEKIAPPDDATFKAAITAWANDEKAAP